MKTKINDINQPCSYDYMSSSLAKQLHVYSSTQNMKAGFCFSGSGGGGIEAGLQREPAVVVRLRGKASLMKPEGADLGAAAVLLTALLRAFQISRAWCETQ